MNKGIYDFLTLQIGFRWLNNVSCTVDIVSYPVLWYEPPTGSFCVMCASTTWMLQISQLKHLDLILTKLKRVSCEGHHLGKYLNFPIVAFIVVIKLPVFFICFCVVGVFFGGWVGFFWCSQYTYLSLSFTMLFDQQSSYNQWSGFKCKFRNRNHVEVGAFTLLGTIILQWNLVDGIVCVCYLQLLLLLQDANKIRKKHPEKKLNIRLVGEGGKCFFFSF